MDSRIFEANALKKLLRWKVVKYHSTGGQLRNKSEKLKQLTAPLFIMNVYTIRYHRMDECPGVCL